MEEEPSLIVLDYTDIADGELLTFAAAKSVSARCFSTAIDGEIEVRSPLIDAEEWRRTVPHHATSSGWAPALQGADIVACPAATLLSSRYSEVIGRFSHLKHLESP